MAVKNHQDHILFSYSFNQNGNPTKILKDQAFVELKTPELSWVHLDISHKNIKKWLKEEVDYLDSIVIDALTTNETRPRI